MVEDEKLIQRLLGENFITPEDVKLAKEIAARTNKKISEVLLDQGLITPETLATTLGLQLNVPVVDLRNYKVQPKALALIPEEIARKNKVLPLAADDFTITVAMENPKDLRVIDLIANLTKRQVKPVIPLGVSLNEALDAHYRLCSQMGEQICQMLGQVETKAAPEALVTPEAIKDSPVVKVVDTLLSQAVRDKASDIHIEPQEDRVRVRYRIDGVLQEVTSLPLEVHNAILTRIKVMGNLNIAERRRPQDGQFSRNINGKQVDFRVATVGSDYGEMAVLRVLDKSILLLKLADLGMSPDTLDSYMKLLQAPFGMILVSGPTGSGKTTTLYASISLLDAKERNIMTIEDPIEYRFKDINQIQVQPQAGITFASGLRAIMRLDPDIILVGEIRDAETANTAVQAALTGHLVLSSIHANDAVGAIIRLMDMGIEPFLLTSAVIGSLSQRLVRKVCPYCREVKPASPAEVLAYQEVMKEIRTEFYYGQGCNFCSQTGYRGRIGVFELLTMSDEIRKLVMKERPAAEIKEQAIKEGMIPLAKDGMLKAREGLTTPSEVIRNVYTLSLIHI